MTCAQCGGEAGHRCGRCRGVRYCGAACQRLAWPTHCATCVPGALQIGAVLVGEGGEEPNIPLLQWLLHQAMITFPDDVATILDAEGMLDAGLLDAALLTGGAVRHAGTLAALTSAMQMWYARDAAQSSVAAGPVPLDLVAKLGEGSYGTVYRASDPATGREYALKTLGSSEAARTEASALRWVNRASPGGDAPNAHVLRFEAFWEAFPHGRGTTTPALLAEYVSGMSLSKKAEFARGRGERPYAIMNWVAEQLYDGLAYLHQRGIAHRDIKPDNVMLTGWFAGADGAGRYGRIVIVDLGLSCTSPDAMVVMGPDAACDVASVSGGAWIYTAPDVAAAYLANRRWAGGARVTADQQFACDVWGAALTLFDLVSDEEFAIYEVFTSPTLPDILRERRVDGLLAAIAGLHVDEDAVNRTTRAIASVWDRAVAAIPATTSPTASAAFADLGTILVEAFRPERQTAEAFRDTLAAHNARATAARTVAMDGDARFV